MINRGSVLALTAVVAACLSVSEPLGTNAVVGSNRCQAKAATPPSHPDIVLILTDDQTYGQLAYMPVTRALIGDEGAAFTHYFVSLSLCCSSRVTILTGRYAHNHGVLSNVGPNGGWPKFHSEGGENSTIATWLHQAGYRTGLVGKYLNDYPNLLDSINYIPPGWDEWDAFLNPEYFNYAQNRDGRIVGVGDSPADYSTDVLLHQAVAFICNAVQRAQPFFLYLAPYAPHLPSTPAPRYSSLFDGIIYPHGPAFNEADVTDKLWPVNILPPIPPDTVALIDTLYERQLESLQAVDDMVRGIFDALQSGGVMQDTYIFFTSDNGFHMGEHRLRPGKTTYFEEDIHVPLLVRGPGIPPGGSIPELAVNTDLAPTMADLAGVTPASTVDGRSLMPLLIGGVPPLTWRKAFAVDAYLTGAVGAAIRTTTTLYRRAPNDAQEMYDLRSDPFELQNIGTTAADSVRTTLTRWLQSIATCAGATCRAVEDSIF